MRLNLRFILLLITTLLFSACASTDKQRSAAEYYRDAQKAVQESNYETAIQLYEELEAQYPYGQYAEQAQLDLAYVYYKSRESESAIAAADRFIKLHPSHPKVDYAYYMRGLASFEQNRNFLYEAFGQKPLHREPDNARRSFNYFSELVKKFPNSSYRDDAMQRMVHLRNRLAAYEVYVANFYYEREAYLAAANRGKYVVENYQNTPAVGDALAVMTRAYVKMEMMDLAEDSYRVLKLSFPTHPAISELANIGKASGSKKP